MSDKPVYKKPSTILYVVICIAVLSILIVPFMIKSKRAEVVTFKRDLMGTIVEITVPVGPNAEAAVDRAYSEIGRLEALLSSYRLTSDVSRISANAGGASVEVSAETIEVIEAALKVAQLSGGAFDPTIGALIPLWGPSGESETVPSKEAIYALLPLVDYTAVIVDREAGKVRLANKGMKLNLGGVAKGYIVGAAIRVLKENEMTRGIIKAGGDLSVFHVLGARGAVEEPYLIGIQHPRKKGKLLGSVRVTDGAVTTSGDYERFFKKNGVRYHHILDPGTGMPASLSQSVTVTAIDPTFADALSTAVFVMGPVKGMALLEKFDGVEGAIVDANGNLTLSSGFELVK